MTIEQLKPGLNYRELPSAAVYKCIADVQGDLARTGVSKDGTNKFDNYPYRSIDKLMNTLAPVLAKHALLMLPRVVERQQVERTAKSGQPVFYTVLTVEFDFVAASDGSSHTIRTYGEAMDRGDKSTNKALSSAFKYACFTAFCIPVDSHDDADRESHELSNEPVEPTEFDEVLDELRNLIDQPKTNKNREEIYKRVIKGIQLSSDTSHLDKLGTAVNEFAKRQQITKKANQELATKISHAATQMEGLNNPYG